MTSEPKYFTDPDAIADYIIHKTNRNITFATQLGLGKPNGILNALYKRAKSDSSIKLKIMTALSLETPEPSGELEKRLMEPLIKRVWGGYIPLEYACDVKSGKLPGNIEVSEFFFKAGAYLNNNYMQQKHICTNYTHAARDVMANGMNVLGALISKKNTDKGERISLGCNGDISFDLIKLINENRKKGFDKCCSVAEVNSSLPFMYGEAEACSSSFDAILENPASETALFSVPRESVSTTDYMIGLNASPFVKDNGTIQIGIGSLGDSVATALILRHENNEEYKKILEQTNAKATAEESLNIWGETGIFEKGLYGATEMFVDGMLKLYNKGLMKRRCYDNLFIQRLCDSGVCKNGNVSSKALEWLIKNNSISAKLTRDDVDMLVKYGIFKSDVKFENGYLVYSFGKTEADLDNKEAVEKIIDNCLGSKLKNGFWLHAGFYLGPEDFYETLRLMPEEERMQINMTSVLNVNQLYDNNAYINSELRCIQRRNARFMNTGLMVTLFGAVVSDGLENGKVLSGVGGQYNFVTMAHALPDARGIIMIRSTRGSGKKVSSNIVFNYGHITIPRHLRDIVVTEYGIADLRSKSDEDVIKALLNIADSRFQESLLNQAKKAGKIHLSYSIPEKFRNNTPEKLEKILAEPRKKGLFPAFPFGSNFTDEEVVLGKALKTFKAAAEDSKLKTVSAILGSWLSKPPLKARPYLERMKLDSPRDTKEKIMQKIVLNALQMAGYI